MPTKALYLKYRPQTFNDLQGQDHITRTLKNALALNRIAHAYLFTGTRGTGKTSMARILAKAVNCVSTTEEHPCNHCVICTAINEDRLLDLVEIDAASNNGVEHIRDLREKVDFRPSEAHYKVYIIDEAHMLSPAAFNALLKTLEEPPPHVIFVLATTEANKIPLTIASRCQRFDFRRATLAELNHQLQSIALKENMNFEPAALELIARQANGSFRDATSLLDQLTAYSEDKITLGHVQSLLGAASPETIHAIVASIATRDLPAGIAALGNAVDAGADPRQLAREVVEYLRGVLLIEVKDEGGMAVDLETRAEMQALAAQLTTARTLESIRLFNAAVFELRASAGTTLPLEIALVESALQTSPAVPSDSSPASASSTGNLKKDPTTPKAQPATGPRTSSPQPTSQVAQPSAQKSKAGSASAETKSAPAIQKGNVTLESVREQWDNFIIRLKEANKNAPVWLQDANVIKVDENTVTVGFLYGAHKERVESDKKARSQIEALLTEMFGKPLHIKCVISPKKKAMEEAQEDPLVRTAVNLGARIVDVEEE